MQVLSEEFASYKRLPPNAVQTAPYRPGSYCCGPIVSSSDAPKLH